MIGQVPKVAGAGLDRRYLVAEAHPSGLGISVNAGSTGAAWADSVEIELAEIGGAKGHGELVEHLLVSQVLGRERPLTGVKGSLASGPVLGAGAGLLVAAAPGKGPREF